MGRKAFQGWEYFGLDVDFWSDEKIQLLNENCGKDGVLTFVLLLASIYKNGHFVLWDDVKQQGFCCQHKIKIAFLDKTLSACLKVGLFDRQIFTEHSVLTSRAIQRRILEMSKTARRVMPSEESMPFWILNLPPAPPSNTEKSRVEESRGLGLNPNISEEMYKNVQKSEIIDKKGTKWAEPLPEELARHYAKFGKSHVDAELPKCRDWCLDKGTTSKDWEARRRNWFRKAYEFNQYSNRNGQYQQNFSGNFQNRNQNQTRPPLKVYEGPKDTPESKEARIKVGAMLKELVNKKSLKE